MTLLNKFVPSDFDLNVKKLWKVFSKFDKTLPGANYFIFRGAIPKFLCVWKTKAVKKYSVPLSSICNQILVWATDRHTCIGCHVQQWTSLCFNCHLHYSVTCYWTVSFHCKIRFHFCSAFLRKLLIFNVFFYIDIHVKQSICMCVYTHCVFVLVIF